MSTFEVKWLDRCSQFSAEVVRQAVEGFVERHGVPPAGMVVHPRQVAEMEKVLQGMLAQEGSHGGLPLQLTSLAVREQRGMLVTEFWMERAKEERAEARTTGAGMNGGAE